MSDYWNEEAPNQPAENTGLENWLTELQQERLENWRREALEKHPQLAPLREYLTANTKAETMALADDLASKLGSGQPAGPGTAVSGGSPAIVRHPGDTEYTHERAMEDRRNGVPWEDVLQKRLTQKFHDVGSLAPWEE